MNNNNNTTKVLITSSIVFNLIIGFTSTTLAFGQLSQYPTPYWLTADQLDRLVTSEGSIFYFECPLKNAPVFKVDMSSPRASQTHFQLVENLSCGEKVDLTDDQRNRILQSYPNGTSIFSCPNDSSKNHTVSGDLKFTQESFTAMESVECVDTEKMNQTAKEYKARGDEQVKILANALAQGGEDEFDKELKDLIGFEPSEGIRDALLSNAEKYNTEQGIIPQEQEDNNNNNDDEDQGFEMTDELENRIVSINGDMYKIQCPDDSSKTFTLNFGMSDEWPKGQFERVQESSCS